MKFSFLFFFVVQLFFSQEHIFTYDYEFVIDSTNSSKREKEVMVLNIGTHSSEYFNCEKMKFDSLRMVDASKKIYDTQPSRVFINTDRIIKYNNSVEIVHFVSIGQTFKFIDDRTMDWELHPEFSTILNYSVQKATTHFAGRKWIAWFASEIPFQDGPYKFRGLPGLIFQIEDADKFHVFTLQSISKSSENFIYPNDNLFHELPTLNRSQFKKKFKEYRNDPVAYLVGKIPDQPDQYGNLRKGSEILNGFRKKEIEKLKKENNIIEIDLLKQ